MGLRTICFIGAVVCWVVLEQIAIAWLLLVGAVLLPYVAVVVANAGRERSTPLPTTVVTDQRQALGPGANDAPPTPQTPTDDPASGQPGSPA